MSLALLSSGAMAAKLTGGAETVTAGGVIFSVTANAISTDKGIKGHIQYTRENQSIADLIAHASVECFGISTDGLTAVAAGPATVQYNPNNLTTGAYLVIWVHEGGTGFGDAVRVYFATEAQATAICANPDSANAFPGEVLEGNFTIRAD
jgi:hypothetical protein